MKTSERERHDWIIIPLILLIGFLCVFLAGSWAIRFPPQWQLNANMESNINPNSDFLTSKPSSLVEPVDSFVLTAPAWLNVFLTPGASLQTGTPFPTPTATIPVILTSTMMAPDTATVTADSTNAPVYIPPTATPRRKRGPTSTTEPPSTPTTMPTVPTVVSTSTPMSILPVLVDLQITQTDNASMYVASGTLTYTITLSNNGPNGITGAVVTDNIPHQIISWTWVCTAQDGGASGCVGLSGSTDFSDVVDLPNGASIIYSVTASVSANASGDLTNTASVSLPAGFTDPVPLNNSATDVDQILIANSFPWKNIGTSKDGRITTIDPGQSLTLKFGSPLVVDGHPGYDLVYYELPAGSGILMDFVILQLGDGNNWYTVLNWGDNLPDTNTNLDLNVIGGIETDNRDISSALLYNGTGVAINLDSVVPNGTYPYIRIISPAIPGEAGDGCNVDAIQVLP